MLKHVLAALSISLTCFGAAFSARAQCGDPRVSSLAGVDAIGPGDFGEGVAVNSDSTIVLVGAPLDNQNRGAVFVFARIGNSWIQQGPKLSSNVVGTGFGSTVALSDDGNLAAVGAPRSNGSRGAIFFYSRSGASWTFSGGIFQPHGDSPPYLFGERFGLSGDGNTCVVGSRYDQNGAVYVYTRTPQGTWAQTQTFTPPVGSSYASFGNALALSGNGQRIAVGVLGGANVYERVGTSWSQLESFGIPGFDGGPFALSHDGNSIVIGEPTTNGGVGRSVAMDRVGGAWTVRGTFGSTVSNCTPQVNGGCWFGGCVAISADATRCIVGEPRSSLQAAYIFDRSQGEWSQQGAALEQTCGWSVAMSADGRVAVVGKPFENFGLGGAYIVEVCPCRADFDGYNGLQVADIYAFLAAWFLLDSRADFNGTGGITAQDIFDFLNAWFAGCA